MKNKIWLSSPHMGNEELANIIDVFNTNWIAPVGSYIDLFESKLSEVTKVTHSAAFNSGTASIHLALKLLDVQTDDIVLCQSLTFAATVNPVIYQNGTPVFIDSEIETWNMCPTQLELAINKYISLGRKPKAILLVHLYGMPAKIDEIAALATKYSIPIIEDAAEALGSKYNGNPCGSFGKYGVLSFNGNKIITTSAGGALLSNSKKDIDKAKYWASQAKEPTLHYEHTELGYNYRMSNVLAAIGVGQLSVLEERVNRRREIFEIYKKELSNFKGISFLEEAKGFYSNRWLTTILIGDLAITPEKLIEVLAKENIESRPLWKPMHLQPFYKEFDFIGDGVSESLFNHGLCLPSGSNLTNEEIFRVIKVIKKIYRDGI